MLPATRAVFTIWHSASWGPSLRWLEFCWPSLLFGRKMLQSTGAPRNSIVSSRNHILYHFSTGAFRLHLASFYETKYF